MTATMALEELISRANAVGVVLRALPEGQTGKLYAWVSQEGDVLYVGKSASAKRVREESSWAQSDLGHNVLSAFPALIQRNGATCQPLDVLEFAADRVRPLMNGWEGGAIDALREWLDDPRPPGDEFVEKFLVRVMVRAGVPTGNSQFASQWEGPLGQPADTLALFAVQDLWQGQVPSA